MITTVERDCRRCLRATRHKKRGQSFTCLTCQTSTNMNGGKPVQKTTGRGVNGGGVSGRGVSGEGDQSSLIATASATTAYAEMLSGEALTAIDGDPAFARFVCIKAGIAFKQDEPQTIVLGDTVITIRLWVDNDGHYVIRPVVAGERNPAFPHTKTRALKLGQFYASVCAGRLIHPVGPSLARWKRRALAEWGKVALPQLRLKTLPDDAPRYAEQVWAAIGLLVAVRRLTEPNERSIPLTRSFVPPWCGCDEPTARRAIVWLERNRFIWRVGSTHVGRGRPMTMWAVAEEPA